MRNTASLLGITFAIAVTHGQPSTAQASQTDIAEMRPAGTGPHHRVWEQTVWEDTGFGDRVPRVSRLTELASGLNFFNPATRQWEPSQEEFWITPQGYAVATNAQHQVMISPILNDSAGAVDLLTPDGRRLRSTILALNLHNRVTGQSMFVAEVATNALGQMVGSNVILFPDCFDGFGADVRFEFRRGEFHQDVLIREKLDLTALAAAGFPEGDSDWEIWTEFFEAPEPSVKTRVALSESDPAKRARMVEPDVLDEELDFGVMKMPTGTAYLRDEEGLQRRGVNVFKRWLKIEGRTFLVETIPLNSLRSLLPDLPSGSGASHFLEGKSLYAGRRAPAPVLSRPRSERIVTALNREPPGGPQLVMDYFTVNGSLTNYVFVSGCNDTYWVTGPVYLYNTGGLKTIVEGNAVVKFAKNVGARLVFNGPVEFQTAHYKPAVFTAQDDRSVGMSYSFGSGNPTGYYASTALEFNVDGPLTIEHVRVAYAQTAFHFKGATSAAVEDTLRHIQIRDSGTGVYVEKSTYARSVDVANALFSKVTQPFNGYLWSGEVAHATVDQCGTLAGDTGSGGGVLAFTNSIFVNATNLGSGLSLQGSHNAFYNCGSSFGGGSISLSALPFLAAESGRYYLAIGSALRNAGSTNLDSSVLAGLRKTTTYAPLVLTNVTISADTDFGPVVQRDTDEPDIGWHYDPLDHVFGGCHGLANLTFKAGTAIGWFRTSSGWVHAGYGIRIGDGKTLLMDGTVSQPVYFVRTTSVQERHNGAFLHYGPGGLVSWATSVGAAPTVRARYAICANLDEGGLSNHFRDDSGVLKVEATGCEFWAGALGGYGTINFYTNSLFDRTAIWLDNSDPNFIKVIMRNCTMYGGSLSFSHRGGVNWYSSVRDSAFDGTTFAIEDNSSGNPTYVDYDYNAFLQGATNTNFVGPNDVAVTSFDWEDGPLGGFYLPSNSALIDQGSRSADAAGLYHFTTQANQNSIESTSTVDIGFHRAGVGFDNQPLDSDGDGTPNYLEDTDGDGTLDSGETDWINSSDPGLRVRITRPRAGTLLP